MKKAFLYIIVILSFTSLLFSQQSYSRDLETILLQDKYSLEIELLKGSLSPHFPYNIIISYKNQYLNEEKPNNIALIISQEFAYTHYDSLRPLFDLVSENKLGVEILLSANDGKIHSSLQASLQGIQTYIENKGDFSQLYAIVITQGNEKNKNELALEIGTKNYLTPLPLVKDFINKIEKANLNYKIKGGFSSFVRLGLMEENSVLDYLLKNDIPSIALDSNVYTISELIRFVGEYLKTDTPIAFSEQSSQYSFFYIFNHFFSFSEFHLISLILVLVFITLILIVFFPFLLGRSRFIHKQELQRTWPLLPLLIIANGLFYYASQNLLEIVFPHFHSFPQFAFLIKLIFSLLFLFIISLAQIIFKFPLSSFIYGYLGSFIAFINIFIFTFIDISFFIPFSLEFLILIMASNSKTKKSIFFTLVLMVLPFLPYFLFTDLEVINNLLRISNHTSLFGNILLALLLIPFQIVWIKILIRMKHFGKQKGVTFKRILIDIAMNLGAIVFIIIGIQILIRTNIISQEAVEKPDLIKVGDNSYITSTYIRLRNYDTEDIELVIESSLPVLRYEIKIHTPSILPIYEANYPYDILTEQEWAIFSLDDFPPELLPLRFSSQASLNTTVVIKAYLLDTKDVITSELSILFRGDDE